MELSPITVVRHKDDPNATDYQISLPTRANDNGEPLIVSYDKSVPYDQAIADINVSFPRNSADTQIDKMQGGADYVLNRMTKEDYLSWKKDKDLLDDAHDISLVDIAKHAAIDFGTGLVNLGMEGLKAVGSFDERKSARALYNVTEGFLVGTERLGMLGQLAFHAGQKAVLPSSLDYQKDEDFATYKKMYEMADVATKRSNGELLTQGAQSPILPTVPGALQPSPDIQASPADVRAANSISNALDASWLLAGSGLLAKAGASIGLGSVASKLVPSAVINEMLPQLAMKGASLTGTALDATSKFVINSLAGVVDSVTENSISRSAQIVGQMASRQMLYGADFMYGTGGYLVGAALGGKALRAGGEVGSAVLKGLQKGSVREALLGLGENTTKAATVRSGARMALAIAPPDTFTNAMKSLADSAVNTGAFMGAIGAMQAYALDDDPIHGMMEGFAAGLGVGAVAGVPHFASALINSKENRVAALFKKDLTSRALDKTLEFIDANGEATQVNIVDSLGRMNLYNNKNVSLDAKELIISMATASEKAGNDFIFHDGTEATTKALDELGLLGGTAVHIRRGNDGRSTIIFNPEHATTADLAQEVFHSMFSDSVAKDVFAGIAERIKSEDPTLIAKELLDFSNKYTRELAAISPEVGAEKQAHFNELIDQASQPSMSSEDRINILGPILDEYVGHYAGAKTAGAKVKDLLPSNTRNLVDKAWDKTVGNILSAFDFSKQDIHQDPVYGHFFNSDGKLAMSPIMDGIVNKVLTAVSEGKSTIEARNSFDGVRYFDVTKDRKFFSIEDKKDGEWTTSESQKNQIKREWFYKAHAIASADPGAGVLAYTENLSRDGTVHANISRLKEGDPLIYTQRLSDESLMAMARIEVNGRRVITPDQETGWLAVNKAIREGRIITTDAWHDIGRSQGSRENQYYGRSNRHILPVSLHQTKEGGLNVGFIDISRAWSHAQRIADVTPSVKAEMMNKGINSLQKFIPFLQSYFDNYSSPNRIPAALLPGFSEGLRDLIYNSLNVKPRSEKSKYYQMDRDAMANVPTFETNLFGENKKETIDINGNKIQMSRGSVVLGQMRLDRVMGVSDFTLNGAPAVVAYNPTAVPNAVRANFAARSTTSEVIGTSEFVTDTISGKRMVIAKDGKTTLFENGKKSVHATPDDAERAANNSSIKIANEVMSFQYKDFQFAARKNAYTSRSKPAEGKEAEHALAKTEYEKLKRDFDAGKLKAPAGQDKKNWDRNIKANLKVAKDKMMGLSEEYHTKGNTGGTGSFYENPLIAEMLGSGLKILTPSEAMKRPDWEYLKPHYDFFNSNKYSIDGYIPAFHYGIFSKHGKSPATIMENLAETTHGYFEYNKSSPEDFFQAIQDISKSSRLFDIHSASEAEHANNAASFLISEGGKQVETGALEIGQEFKAGKDYIAKVLEHTYVEDPVNLGDEIPATKFGFYNAKATADGGDAGTVRIAEITLDHQSAPTIKIGEGKAIKTPKAKAKAPVGKEIDLSRFAEAPAATEKVEPPMVNEQVNMVPSVKTPKPQPESVTKSALITIGELKKEKETLVLEQEKISSKTFEDRIAEAQQQVTERNSTDNLRSDGDKVTMGIGQRKRLKETVKDGEIRDAQRAAKIAQQLDEINASINKQQEMVGVFEEPVMPEIPYDQRLQQHKDSFNNLINSGLTTSRELSSKINQIFKDGILTREQAKFAQETLRGKNGANSYEAQRNATRDWVNSVLNENAQKPIAPPEVLEPAIKVDTAQLYEFLESHEFKKADAANQRKEEAAKNKAEREQSKEAKAEMKSKSAKDMTPKELASLSKEVLEAKLSKLNKQQQAQATFDRNKFIIEDLAATQLKRGSTGDVNLDMAIRPESIHALTSITQLEEIGAKLAGVSLDRFQDYLSSKIIQLGEKAQRLAYKETSPSGKVAQFPEQLQPGMDYADILIRRSEIKKAARESLKEDQGYGSFPVPEELQQVNKQVSTRSAFKKGEVAVEQPLMLEVKPIEFNLAEFEARMKQANRAEVPQASESKGSPAPSTESLTLNNPVALPESKVFGAEHFKNPNLFYRVIHGNNAFQDIVNSGLVRTDYSSKPKSDLKISLENRPTLFPSFSKGEASMSYAQKNSEHYIITSADPSIKPSTRGRHSAGKTMFPTDELGNHLESLDASKVQVYKHIGNEKYKLVDHLAKKDNKAVSKPASKAPMGAEEYVAKKEAQDYLKKEARAKFQKEVEGVYARNRGEESQRNADRFRNEQHAIDMEFLLKERDARFSSEPPSTKEAKKEGGLRVVSGNIPATTEIVYTPSRKFKVYAISTGILVGIAPDYDKALNVSKKYATKKR